MVTHDSGLPKVLGFWEGVAITVGSIIGSGIFLTAPKICAQFASPIPAIVLWILAGALSLFGVFTFAELAATKPNTGGLYVYLEDGYGKPLAFIYGWAWILVLRPASLGAIAIAFAGFFNELFGGFFQNTFAIDVGIRKIVIAAISFLTIINIIGTKHSSIVMSVFTILKVAGLALLILAGIVVANGDMGHFKPLGDFSARDGNIFKAIGVALVGILWAYDGWCDTTLMTGEVRNPQKTMPRILLVSILGVIVIYVATNLAYIYALGIEKIGVSGNVAGDTIRVFLGGGFGIAITFAILCSTFGATNGFILTGARLTYAMAQSGLTFRFLGIKSERLQTPVVALLVQGVSTIAFVAIWPSFFKLIDYFVFTTWIFYVLGAGAIFIFRARGYQSSFRAPLYPLSPIIFILVGSSMTINEISYNFLVSAKILGVLVLGFPVYYIWRNLAGVNDKK